jgi:proliferating cell nuclear antigen PCNA
MLDSLDTFSDMEVRISDANLFRRAVEALREFLPQAQLRITKAGIQVNGMDASHVGFVDFLLSSKDCEIVKLPAETESANIGISLTVLSRALATCGNTDALTLTEVGDRLKVQCKTEGRSANFELPTLHIQDDIVQIPDMEYGATIKAKSADIAGMIRDLAIFGDNARLGLDENGFHVQAKGDMGEGDLTLEPTEDRDMSLGGDSVHVEFGMKYLQQIVKHASSMASTMELAFDEGQPLRVTTQFGKGSHFMAYLAPKVSED